METKRRFREYSYFRIEKGQTIVDLGAGIGKTSLFFSRKVGGTGLVVAVEPVVENYLRLVSTIINHRLTNVIPVMMAVWQETGCALINISDRWFNHSMAFKRALGQRVTSTISWDDLVDVCQLKHVDLAKIDIEGGETNVLKGMTKVLPDKIILEEHLRNEKGPEKTLKEVIRLLEKKGYKLVKRGIHICAEK